MYRIVEEQGCFKIQHKIYFFFWKTVEVHYKRKKALKHLQYFKNASAYYA